MNNILSEKEYQKYILKKLAASGYEVQPADHYDRLFAVSRQELMRFLETTQPDEMESLKKIYKEKTEEVIVSAINAEETKKRGSRLDVLKHGVEIANVPLKLMYAKPATTHIIKNSINCITKTSFLHQKRCGRRTKKELTWSCS